MRILGNCIVMQDEFTLFFGHRVNNRAIGIFLCLLQMIVSATSLAQHVISLLEFRNIFNCHINIAQSSRYGSFLAYDIVIFDFGLFHFLLGTKECIANYLDGGYMRCMWCTSHVLILLWLFIILATNRRWPVAMCPVILMQSFYALGLIILTIAIIPKILNTVALKLSATFVRLFTIYMVGMAATWFFTFVVWHYYWFLEAEQKMAKQRSKKSRHVRLLVPKGRPSAELKFCEIQIKNEALEDDLCDNTMACISDSDLDEGNFPMDSDYANTSTVSEKRRSCQVHYRES